MNTPRRPHGAKSPDRNCCEDHAEQQESLSWTGCQYIHFYVLDAAAVNASRAQTRSILRAEEGCDYVALSILMSGRLEERRATSLKPALRKADPIPVQANTSGIGSFLGSTG